MVGQARRRRRSETLILVKQPCDAWRSECPYAPFGVISASIGGRLEVQNAPMVAAQSQAVHVACPACAAVNRIPAARLGEGPCCGTCGTPLLDGKPAPIEEEARFDAMIGRTELPVVVDFWAGWCAPCRAMAPALERAAAELKTQARFVKVDTERLQGVAQRFGIRSIPTLVLFRHGREVDRISGALDARAIVAWLGQRLA